jgi:hypothetical protein
VRAFFRSPFKRRSSAAVMQACYGETEAKSNAGGESSAMLAETEKSSRRRGRPSTALKGRLHQHAKGRASRRIHQADHGTPLCLRACRTLQPFVAYAIKGCIKPGSCALRISVNWSCTRDRSRTGKGATSTALRAGTTSTLAHPPASAIPIRLLGGRVRSPNPADLAESVVLAQQSIPQRGFRVSE